MAGVAKARNGAVARRAAEQDVAVNVEARDRAEEAGEDGLQALAASGHNRRRRPRLRRIAGRIEADRACRANVILHQIDAGRRYDVYVHSSFADYLWNWLERAAGEYGFAVVDGA